MPIETYSEHYNKNPRQIWIGSQRPTEERMNKISLDSIRTTPTGGFWTSSLTYKNGSITSDWVEWYTSQSISSGEKNVIWSLSVPNDVRVYRIKKSEDASKIVHNRDYCGDEFCCINWERVFLSMGCSALHLTRSGYRDLDGINNSYAFVGWDCEMYLWNEWKFKDRRKEGKIEFFSHHYERN